MSKTQILVLISLFILFMPLIVLANGGDQRLVEDKYLINVSRAPFTPQVGVKTSMLASFLDIQKSKLIAEDIVVNVRIAKLGEVGTDKRQFLYEQNGLEVRGGVLELSYIFQEEGLHEIFFDFAFASDPKKVYEVPDFLIDVQNKNKPAGNTNKLVLIAFVSIAAGFLAGWFTRNLRKKIGTSK